MSRAYHLGAAFTLGMLCASSGFPLFAQEPLSSSAPQVRSVQEDANAAGAAFFAHPVPSTFKIEIGPAEYQQLSHSPRQYVEGRVCVDGRIYDKVGIRLKGTGTFQPVTKHPNLALKFNWRNPSQAFNGLTKVYLNNSRQDATLLCDATASAIFADAGIAVPRITHARVDLNGRALGLCVVSEAVNKRFLKRHFGKATGLLYEGAFRDIGSRLEQDNGTISDASPLMALRSAAAHEDRGVRLDALAKVLDIDRFLDFVSIERMVANWDGYAGHQNNYRLYNDPVSGRFHFIPHGLDNSIFESGMSIMPPRKSILVGAILEAPADRAAFRDRVRTLFPKVFNLEKIEGRLEAQVAKMKQGASGAEIAAIDRRSSLMRQRLQERAAHIRAELEGAPRVTPSFDSKGIALLQGWLPKPDWNHSTLEQVTTNDRTILSIRATNGYCFGSWRLPLALAPGHYRIEGHVATSGVRGLPSMTGSGAGVRLLGTMRGGGIDASSDWTPVHQEFTVKPGCEWVELIAELRSFTGSATFDASKFRLVRLAD